MAGKGDDDCGVRTLPGARIRADSGEPGNGDAYHVCEAMVVEGWHVIVIGRWFGWRVGTF